jgi:hypothetical protein
MPPAPRPAGRTSVSEAVRGLAWLGVLAMVAWGASSLGRGALAPPPLTDPGSWAGWTAARSPIEAGFAVLTLVVVALAWYLAAVTALATAGRLVRARRLVRVADLLTLPLFRPAVHAALGLGLVGASVAGVAAGPGPRSGLRSLDPAAASLVVATAEAARAPTGGAPEPVRSTDGDDPAARPVMRLLPPEAPGAAEVVPPSAPVLPIEHASPPAATPMDGTEWEVRPGDHLWSVAAAVLQEAWGAPASDAEVAPYWQRLVEANRAGLADPANPDLLYPGQVVTVPAPPPVPR